MRRPIAVVVLGLSFGACGSSDDPVGDPQTFDFGPFALSAGQEINNQCVSATLGNDAPIYVSAVELTTGTGFHHSNWFTVPDTMFDGPDGTWRCAERGYDEAIAGIAGGVLFAQSTQATHEVQQFPPGVAIVIPAHSRIVAGTHLLNTGDDALSVDLALKITPVAKPPTLLSAMSFTNQSITLPPHRKSRMTMECDINTAFHAREGRDADFKFYYALAHYHELGTGLTVEALRPDGTASTIYETTHRIGDALGGAIDAFSMTGFDKLRFSCDFDNPRDTAVRWGVGDQEMCTFLAFTDSDWTWGGGALMFDETPTIVDHGDVVEYTYPCDVISSEPIR
ncbi:MAG: hypothetical protein HOV81_01900 [Kofleriaceae bacterium]|nr:hypothetical protein [Kofleriaceae bacterium]